MERANAFYMEVSIRRMFVVQSIEHKMVIFTLP